MRTKGTRHKSYEAAVRFLTKNPDKIDDAWAEPFEAQGGSLFVFASPDGKESGQEAGQEAGQVGCLTQLKGSCSHIDKLIGLPRRVSTRLLKRLRADDRIPRDEDDITAETLPALAEWQEDLDKAYAEVK